MIKNIIVVLGLILLLAAGYYLFVINDSGLEAGNQVVLNQAEAETRELLQRLNELKAIELDTAIFSDDRFTSRVDVVPVLTPQQVGRDNPFLPVN